MFGNKLVRQGKYSVDSVSQDFFYDGFLYKNFEEGPVFKKFYNKLKDLYYNENPEGSFTWNEKYKNTFDLAPVTYSYDDSIIDMLFEQKIPQLIKMAIGEELFLGDVTFRKTYPIRGSYMGWHRDTYQFGSRPAVGRTPPLIKLIYYPRFEEEETLQLEVCKGSHHRFFHSKILDRLQTVLKPSTKIKSSNESFLLFNTFMYHSAAAQKIEKGGARIIFNFCTKAQLSQFEGREELHSTYMKRLESNGDNK